MFSNWFVSFICSVLITYRSDATPIMWSQIKLINVFFSEGESRFSTLNLHPFYNVPPNYPFARLTLQFEIIVST